jgi:site-specific DNA recombinase
MVAARKKGKFVGGAPVLGYDLARDAARLVVNAHEATRVRQIFHLYLEHQSLLATIAELHRRGWTTKRWTTRAGRARGGKPFTTTALHKLLTNSTYIGKVKYQHEMHTGEHEAIVDLDTWQRVQALLQRNGRSGGTPSRSQCGALLKGLLRCVPCGCAMTPSHSTKNGTKRYRYYVCSSAQKRGWSTCPSRSIPAGEIEQLVVEQIQSLGRNPALLHEVLTQVRQQQDARRTELQTDQRSLAKELARHHAELRQLAQQLRPGDDHGAVRARLADLQARINEVEQRAAEVRAQSQALAQQVVPEDDVAAALARFQPVWDALTPREQARVFQLLVERVEYHGGTSRLTIRFHPPGLKTLAAEWAGDRKEQIA